MSDDVTGLVALLRAGGRTIHRSGVVAVLVLASLLGCGTSVTVSDPSPSPQPTPSSSPRATGPAPPSASGPSASGPSASPTSPPRSPSAAPSGSRGPTPPSTPPHRPLDDWDVGADPLPLRADGFGQVLETPPQLRVRRMPTVDRLPPPSGGFRSRIEPISAAVRARMGQTWHPGCPVRLAELRYLTVSFWGFDRRAHTGELVVNAQVAEDVVGVFHRLFAARFPIEQMRLVTTADLDAAPTGDGNNTAALVCRSARGTQSWSAHAYGLAIDINPFQNPYHNGDLVLPELASAYLDRDWRRPGMVTADGVVVEAFAGIGWTWGGQWESLTDLMHFSATGR